MSYKEGLYRGLYSGAYQGEGMLGVSTMAHIPLPDPDPCRKEVSI